jgi:hypothetical protein
MSVNECDMPPPDPHYIEGAIELIINGTEIIGKAHGDYVDQLWSYIAAMTEKLSREDEVSTYFPDQPILLTFSRVGNRLLVSSRVSSGVRRASADESELLQALRTAGRRFFDKMSELVPSNLDSYQVALASLSP